MTIKNELGNKVENIYKQHNGLEIESRFKSHGVNLSFVDSDGCYKFESETEKVEFDLNGDLISSSIEVPTFILDEMSSRAKKTQNMINLIW